MAGFFAQTSEVSLFPEAEGLVTASEVGYGRVTVVVVVGSEACKHTIFRKRISRESGDFVCGEYSLCQII